MFIAADDQIYELLVFNEKFRSFFIDNAVYANGKIYLTSKFDPLFVFIQFLEENCKTRAAPLDQLLEGNANIFFDYLKIDQMKLVADQKGSEDLKAFMFNEEKVLKWLKIKFKRIVESLKAQNIISAGASSMNFVQSTLDSNNTENQDEIESTALGIISEYISLDLYDKLDKIYGISEKSKEPIVQKRKSKADNLPDSKKVKSENDDVLKEINPVKQQPKAAPKNAAKLEKAAKGTKSISSFFTKK